MAKRRIETRSGAQPIGAYSQGVRAGDFIFVSGQGPLDPQSGDICGGNIEEQTARTLGNIKAVLEAGGASMADVVKVTAHLSDLSLFERYNREMVKCEPGQGFRLRDVLLGSEINVIERSGSEEAEIGGLLFAKVVRSQGMNTSAWGGPWTAFGGLRSAASKQPQDGASSRPGDESAGTDCRSARASCWRDSII